LLIPTRSDELLGSEQWGLGPTAVALKQSNGWTRGILANHIWGLDDSPEDGPQGWGFRAAVMFLFPR
jgi:hypothetical protein